MSQARSCMMEKMSQYYLKLIHYDNHVGNASSAGKKIISTHLHQTLIGKEFTVTSQADCHYEENITSSESYIC